MEWYVVNTFSGYENTVKKNLEERIKTGSLEHLIEEILVPSEKVTERRGKTTVQTTKNFFTGYIIIKMEMSKESWHLVQATPKVTGFLGGQHPRPVPPSEMARMLGGATPAAPVEKEGKKAAPVVIYHVGNMVRVKSGAFANFTGEVEEVNTDKQKVWLSVSLFGRPTRVEVDFAELEPMASA
jgi:transcriptional antiterminator NusG